LKKSEGRVLRQSENVTIYSKNYLLSIGGAHQQNKQKKNKHPI
jgi:hypothetical protein